MKSPQCVPLVAGLALAACESGQLSVPSLLSSEEVLMAEGVLLDTPDSIDSASEDTATDTIVERFRHILQACVSDSGSKWNSAQLCPAAEGTIGSDCDAFVQSVEGASVSKVLDAASQYAGAELTWDSFSKLQGIDVTVAYMEQPTTQFEGSVQDLWFRFGNQQGHVVHFANSDEAGAYNDLRRAQDFACRILDLNTVQLRREFGSGEAFLATWDKAPIWAAHPNSLDSCPDLPEIPEENPKVSLPRTSNPSVFENCYDLVLSTGKGFFDATKAPVALNGDQFGEISYTGQGNSPFVIPGYLTGEGAESDLAEVVDFIEGPQVLHKSNGDTSIEIHYEYFPAQ